MTRRPPGRRPPRAPRRLPRPALHAKATATGLAARQAPRLTQDPTDRIRCGPRANWRAHRSHSSSASVGAGQDGATAAPKSRYQEASLPACRPVRWRPRVAGASPLATAPAGCPTMGRRRCPTDQKTQRPIVGTLLHSLGQDLRMNRAERRPPSGIDDGHHYLRAARRVEYDPIQVRTATRDAHELTWAHCLHIDKVPRPEPPAEQPGITRAFGGRTTGLEPAAFGLGSTQKSPVSSVGYRAFGPASRSYGTHAPAIRQAIFTVAVSSPRSSPG